MTYWKERNRSDRLLLGNWCNSSALNSAESRKSFTFAYQVFHFKGIGHFLLSGEDGSYYLGQMKQNRLI